MLLVRRLACLSLVAATSCIPATDDDPSAAAEPIIGGTNSDSSQDSVVRLTLRSDGGVYSCTGTLLAPNLVLTARHCVSATADGDVFCSPDGSGGAGGAVFDDYTPSGISVSVGVMPVRGGGGRRGLDAGMVTGDAGVRPHGLQIFHDDGTNLCNHDLALLLLDTKIANARISPVRLDGPVLEGETFTAVGWGVTDSGDTPMERQQRTDVTVEDVGSSSIAGIAANEFLVGEVSCSGDSGGPALDTKTQAVIGVVSRGGNGTPADPNNPAASCTGPNAESIYTATSPFKSIILAAYAAAGQDPWPEGGPDPRLGKLGDPCATAADCRSNLCLAGKTASLCTADCSSVACPTGYDCKEDAALAAKVCEPHVAAAASGCSMVAASPGGVWMMTMVLFALAIIARTRRGRRPAR